MKKNIRINYARCVVLCSLSIVLLLGTGSVKALARSTNNFTTKDNFLPPSTVTGKVTDSKNNPMEGVSVVIKGTTRGVVTDNAGNFSIPNVPEKGVLVFSFTGFGSIEKAVGSGSPLRITLTEEISGLNDVVVIGYGTQTKKDLTGAVSQIKATALENENPRTVADLLRGNAAGLDVGFDVSTKGNSSSLQIRGKGTLTASSSPLIVLDGVIYTGTLADINPNDIGTLDILKDASSAAVFGARSANGVILITTKKGKIGKPIITFNDNIGINKVTRKPHLLNAYEFLDWRSDVIWAFNGFDSTSKPNVKYFAVNPTKLPSSVSVAQWQALDGSTGDPTVTWLTRLRMKPIEIANYQAGKFLDWEKLIYNQNALQHDHTISIAQRREDYNYYFSVGYLDNTGLTNGDRYKTLRTRLNLEANATKYLTVGVNFQYSNRDESYIPLSLADVNRSSPWGSFYQDGSTTQLRLSTNDDPGNGSHPFMDQYYSTRMYKYDDFFANLYVKGKLPYGFSYQVNFSPRYDILREYNFQSPNNPLIAARKGIVDRRNQTVYSWNLDNILRWNGKYGKHNIEATFLVNAEKFQSWNTNIHAENFAPNANLGFDAIQSATIPPTVSSDDQYATGDALMGRLNYNYNQRYFLTMTARRDGYSAFGQQNPRATFPSASIAWALTEERFLQNASRWLDYVKLRLSYGENGNREIGRYAALSNLSSGTYVFVTPGGQSYNVSQVQSSNLANPGLKWERNSSVNIGLDYSILKGLISGSIEYYTRTTKDLLVNRSLPSVVGFSSILANLGEVQNKGFEMTINTRNMKRNNIEWTSTISFWLNRNQINHLYGATPDYDATGKVIGSSEKDDIGNGWFIGRDIASVYNYQIAGVWQASEAATAKSFGYKPGDFKLVDQNGDGKFTIADRVFLGTRSPRFSWNFRNDFKLYKNFDFSITLYAKMGQLNIFNENKNVDFFYDRSNFYQRPYWTPDNPINDYAALNSNAGGVVSYNTYKKASFVRISNVSLAYTLPAAISNKWKLQGLKAYINVVNAYVFSGWNYFDPEYKGPNNDTNTAPTPLVLNFGINLTL